jgi:hypothetical protein
VLRDTLKKNYIENLKNKKNSVSNSAFQEKKGKTQESGVKSTELYLGGG